jgi:hypothetical protein
MNNFELALLASPESEPGANDAAFIGTDGFENFLYLVDKRDFDAYSDNLIAKSDVIGDWNLIKGYFQFQSKPNISLLDDKIAVGDTSGYTPSSCYVQREYSAGHQALTEDSYDYDVYIPNGATISDGFIKYISPQGADLRMFFSADIEYAYTDCVERLKEYYFWTLLPDKETAVGFSPDDLAVKIGIRSDS